jgi:hypothetical protein
MLWTNRAGTVFFLPGWRVIGEVAARSGVGVAAWVVAELAEHPRTQHRGQPGLGAVDHCVRVLRERGGQLRGQPVDLHRDRSDHRHQRAVDRGKRGHHRRRLGQCGGPQRLADRGGLRLEVAPSRAASSPGGA